LDPISLLPATETTNTGLDGNDILTTGSGNDVIIAGNGNDTISAGDGRNVILADRGQVVFANGLPTFARSTVSVLSGSDTITSGSGNDAIIAGGNTDIISGGAGNNFILGDDGTISFTAGSAVLAILTYSTSDGNDSITTFGGNDIIYTGDGDNIVNAGEGDDDVYGGSGKDTLSGQGGADFLVGMLGDDLIDGGAGNDVNVDGGDDDDVVRGGSGDDVVHGGLGIDNVYGDDGDDRLFGDAGSSASPTASQTGQRLYGGAGRDTLFAFAPSVASIGEFNTQTGLVGDQLFGGADGDTLNGNMRREVFSGEAGNDVAFGDIFIGPTYLTQALAGLGTQADTHGADDIIHGGAGEDQLFGGGGNDTIFGGAGTDMIEGQRGADQQFGGAGIDLFTIRTDEPSAIDIIDGHFGNDSLADSADDNATDVVMINGTTGNDTILIGADSTIAGRVIVRFNGVSIPITMLDANGKLLVEQFRIAGLAGNDTIGFYTLAAIDSGVVSAGSIPSGFIPLNTDFLATRARDYAGVFDGNSGNDILLGTHGRDQLDGGPGSDTLFGFGGDDRLWGDIGNGSTLDNDTLFAGSGNDDLIAGLGTNHLFAWSFNPSLGGQFGVFVDSQGRLFTNDGGGTLQLENTGLNRMLGSERNDELFGGTAFDFMFGNGGADILYRANGSTFESLDGGLGGDEWKQYTRQSDQVWYVGGTNAADQIDVNFVTEPGLLSDHHLITRLTNNNGNFSFAAQVRLDFEATDANGNLVWDAENLKFRVSELLANADTASRENELTKISQATVDSLNASLLSSLIPPEGDFQVILIDALGGNDRVTVGPTVQKSVWVDGGSGDDTIEILAGNAILVDKTESSVGGIFRGRNDIPAQAFTLANATAGQFRAFDGTLASSDGLEFNGLTIDNPADVDWYRFTLASNAVAAGVIQLASGSPIDSLGLEIYVAGSDPNNPGAPIQTGTSNGNASSISLNGLTAGITYLLKVTTPNIVPTNYSLRMNLTGTTSAVALAAIPKIDLGIRGDSSIRQDVLLGGPGDDILRGGAGEDWIFGNDGNDVLSGGYDRQASDLIFGGNGNDTFQLIPDRLPLLGSQANTEFDPASRTFLPTYSDQLLGGDGNDRIVYLGGDADRRGFDVPDFVAIQYNTGLHRYEFTSLVWDIGTQAYRTTTDGNGLSVFEQEYLFYQTRDIESTEINTRKGNDVVHADAGFQFLPLMVTALANRYSFNETSGTTFVDSVGGANAALIDVAGTTNSPGLGGNSRAARSCR